MSAGTLRVFADPEELSRAAAEEFTRRAATAIAERGRFRIALSGGSTPRLLYRKLSAEKTAIPWESIDFFWGDERHVPPDSEESNYRMASEALLSHIAATAHIYRIEAEDVDAGRAAAKYEQLLLRVFGCEAGEIPQFDLILLGLGPDGHTASLFPGTAALDETNRLVVANRVEKLNTYRITFTAPLINQARCVLFLVSGSDKANALQSVLGGAFDPARLPAQLIHPRGELLWFVDRAAAGAAAGGQAL